MQSNRLVWRLSLQIAQCMQMSWNMDFIVHWAKLLSLCIICFLRFVIPFFFFSPSHVITAAQRNVTGATRFPIASAAISSKSGMSSKSLLWETWAFGNLWAITEVGEAWSAVRGWSVPKSRALPVPHKGETDWLVQSLDLAPLHCSSDEMTPAKRRKLHPVPTYKVSNQSSSDCHMLNRRESWEELRTTCGTFAEVVTFQRQLISQRVCLCLSSNRLCERTVTETVVHLLRWRSECLKVSWIIFCGETHPVFLLATLFQLLQICFMFSVKSFDPKNVFFFNAVHWFGAWCVQASNGLRQLAVQGETHQTQTM